MGKHFWWGCWYRQLGAASFVIIVTVAVLVVLLTVVGPTPSRTSHQPASTQSSTAISDLSGSQHATESIDSDERMSSGDKGSTSTKVIPSIPVPVSIRDGPLDARRLHATIGTPLPSHVHATLTALEPFRADTILPALCMMPVLNCTNVSSSRLLAAALWYWDGPRAPSNDSSRPLTLKFKTETMQQTKLVLPRWREQSHGHRDHLPMVTATPICSAVTVVHLLIGRYHGNLMHTMYRVASVQAAVLTAHSSVRRHCPAGTSPNVTVAVVPRFAEGLGTTPDVGFYDPLAWLIRGARVVVWPHDARSAACVRRAGSPPSASALPGSERGTCIPNAIASYNYIPLYDPPKGGTAQSAFTLLRHSMLRQWGVEEAARSIRTHLGEISSDSKFVVMLLNRNRTRSVRNLDTLSLRIRNAFANDTDPHRVVPWIVSFEGIGMQQQAALMHSADAVIAVHGAALAWLIAARPGMCVAELLPAGWSFMRRDVSMFGTLAATAGVKEHRIRSVRGHPRSTDEAFSRNFSLHSNDVERLVRWLGRCRRASSRQVTLPH